MNRVDFHEVQHTFSFVAAGAAATYDLPIDSLRAGFSRTKIYEVVADGPSDFDLEIYEDGAYSQLNRIYRVQNINSHWVDRLLLGQQYRDRDVTLPTQQAAFHLRVVNNTAAAADITVRVRHLPFYAR